MKGKGVKRLDPNQAPRMLYNAPLHQTMGQCCFCCTNKSVAGRSYIWVMENQLQTNFAVAGGKWCCCLGGCGCGKAGDNVHVQYYDDIDALMPLTCCQKTCQCRSDDVEPTAEWFDDSCLICSCSCPSCRQCWANCCPCFCTLGEAIFIVPYESMPCPCCCCSNRVSSCGCPFCAEIGQYAPFCGEMCACWEGNCCGCCGAMTGAPKMKIPLLPGGLKDQQTAKEAACKINAATREYFSEQTGALARVVGAHTAFGGAGSDLS
jgi:hypothetical protein